jgi:hypothetical protein
MFKLKIDYHLPENRIASNPEKTEEAIKGLLGPSVGSFVIIHAIENIGQEFGIMTRSCISLARVVEVAKNHPSI